MLKGTKETSHFHSHVRNFWFINAYGGKSRGEKRVWRRLRWNRLWRLKNFVWTRLACTRSHMDVLLLGRGRPQTLCQWSHVSCAISDPPRLWTAQLASSICCRTTIKYAERSTTNTLEYPTSLLVTSPNRDIRTDVAPKPNGSFERGGSRLTWFVP